MLLKDIIYKGVETVSASYPEEEAREMVFAYMEDVFGFKRHKHILEPDFGLSEKDELRVLADFRRLASGEPLQYVVGKAYFYGRCFRVTPDVLIPRQETELLCNELLQSDMAGDGDILDLCTGSGCIAWTLALERPGRRVMAVDISDAALAVASSQDFSEEMVHTGACAPQFIKADVLAGPEESPEICEHASVGRKFDFIVSNPPYVMDSEKTAMRANVLEHEPHLALFVPDDDPLKFYEAVARWAVRLLKEGGIGIVEINEALGEETGEVFRRAGFIYTEILRDLHGKDRFVLFSKMPLSKKNRFF